jgi:hypothetical protein
MLIFYLLINYFTKYFNEWQKKSTTSSDISVGDFAVSCCLLKEGWSKEDVIMALISNSHDLNDKKIIMLLIMLF